MSTIDHGFSVSLVVGRGGDGKTYSVVDELANNRLVNWDYDLHTNLPLNIDAIAEHVASRRGCKPDEVRARIHKIPDESLAAWSRGEGGPWESTPGEGKHADLVIDEIHEFCPKRSSHRRPVLDEHGRVEVDGRGKQKTEESHLAWQRWLGMARHPGWMRIQFITQALGKVHPVIEQHSAVRFMMEKTDRRKVPGLGILKADLFELVASFTGSYQPPVHRIEQVKNAQEKWEKNDFVQFVYHKDVFKLYESHSAAGGKSSTEGAGKAERREYQRRPVWFPKRHDYAGHGKEVLTAPTWMWFLWRNTRAVGVSLAGFAIVAFVLCGGIEWTLGAGNRYTQDRLAQLRGRDSSDVVKTSEPAVPPAAVGGPAVEGCGCGAKGRRIAAALADELETLRDQVSEASGVVGVGRDFVAFASGDYVAVGEALEHGPHKGKRLARVELNRGYAVLDDGERLYLWRRGQSADAGEAVVPELIQEAREFAAEDQGSGSRERSVLVSVRTEHEGRRPAGDSSATK